MKDEEFSFKLKQILVIMAELWHQPQWDLINHRLIQQGNNTLDIAKTSFASAESILNPSESTIEIINRVERWKQKIELQHKQ